MKEKEEGWTKPRNLVPIARFRKKHDESTENDKISNTCDGFGENIEI